MCYDVIVNFLMDYISNSQLDSLLYSYNLAGIRVFKFPYRIGLNSHTVIRKFTVNKQGKECYTSIERQIKNYTTAHLQLKLSH
jgi:hypothetical protein